jgi:hypothetical protein
MPWVVGIDEAGYGPNLGPLVQAAVALRLPDHDPAGWESLKPWVRRCHEPDDGRLLVDDSKKVYAGANGFARLADGVARGLGVGRPTLAEFVAHVGLPGAADEAAGEPWFDPHAPLAVADRLEAGDVAVGPARVELVHPPRFNRTLAEHDSKAVVLARGLVALLGAKVAALPAGEPVHVVCDKQGGRNYYGPLLAAAFPDGWVVALRESAGESRYRIDGLGREVTVVFRPRADGDSVSVALASMLCKYLREVCMAQFNAFWAKHVPGLKPTAGYPVDAKRFYAEIRPAMDRLGIPADAVWRRK